MMLKNKYLFLFLSYFFWTSNVFALDVPAAATGYVNDYADSLSASTKADLEEKLRAFELSDSTQIVVAIFPSLDGESIEDFSMRLATQWKIGQKEKSNGVLLLIFPNDRQLRIEVGYGLEDKLTDALSSQIIRNDITPHFKAGRFDDGVVSGVRAIIAVVRGAYVGKGTDSEYTTLQDGAGGLVLWLIIFFLIIYLQSKGGGSRYSRSGRSSSIFWGGGSGSGRSGGGWSSGGGFSGGGGSFGGGGSSGRW